MPAYNGATVGSFPERFAEERPQLLDLPSRRVDAWHRRRVRVTQGSTIRVGSNTSSVPSRWIGEQVDVHVMAECLEVWHGTALVERVPRPRGRHKHTINYRHVIDWLVRKPGAFAAYRHRDAMSPTSRFRRAYDVLLGQCPARAAKDDLRVLELAAQESEAGVDAVLGRLLEWNVPITPTVIAEHLRHDLGLPRAMEVVITTVDLSTFVLNPDYSRHLSEVSEQIAMPAVRLMLNWVAVWARLATSRRWPRACVDQLRNCE